MKRSENYYLSMAIQRQAETISLLENENDCLKFQLRNQKEKILKQEAKINKIKKKLERSIKSIEGKLLKEKDESGRINYITDSHKRARLRGIKTKCKEILRIINEE